MNPRCELIKATRSSIKPQTSSDEPDGEPINLQRSSGGAVLRESVIKALELLQPLRPTLELGDDLLSERQKNQLMQRFYEHMGRCITPQRRSRGCLRAVRQPVTGWPQIQHNDSVEGPLLFKLF